MISDKCGPAVRRMVAAIESIDQGSVQEAGDGYRARCPGHGGQDRNLAIREGSEGQVLLTCFSHGCSASAIAEAVNLGLADLWPDQQSAGHRVPEPDWPLIQTAAQQTGRIRHSGDSGGLAAAYGLDELQDADLGDLGAGCIQSCLSFPMRTAEGRICGMRLRTRMGGKFAYSGSRNGLFLQNPSPEDGPVLVVEGPTDVAAASALGLAAVGVPGSRQRIDWLMQFLEKSGRDVLVVVERDRAGIENALAIKRAEASDQAFTYVVLPGKDLRESIALRPEEITGDADNDQVARFTDYTLEGLCEALCDAIGIDETVRADLLEKCLGAEPEAAEAIFKPVWFPDLTADHAGEPVWEGRLVKGQASLLSAHWKVGKTTLITELIGTMYAGGELLGAEVCQGRALVISEESAFNWMSRSERLHGGEHVCTCLRPFARQRADRSRWGQFCRDVAAFVAGESIDLVIVDTLASVSPITDENDNAQMAEVLRSFESISESGAALLVVHHLAKASSGLNLGHRGASSLPSWADSNLTFERVRDDLDCNLRRLSVVGRFGSESLIAEWIEGTGYVVGQSPGQASREQLLHNLVDLFEPGEWLTVAEVRDAWCRLIDQDERVPGADRIRSALRGELFNSRQRASGKQGGKPAWEYALRSSK